MPYMYSEMQNKLSKTRESPLESMGQIISSRCPIDFQFETVNGRTPSRVHTRTPARLVYYNPTL